MKPVIIRKKKPKNLHKIFTIKQYIAGEITRITRSVMEEIISWNQMTAEAQYSQKRIYKRKVCNCESTH